MNEKIKSISIGIKLRFTVTDARAKYNFYLNSIFQEY